MTLNIANAFKGFKVFLHSVLHIVSTTIFHGTVIYFKELITSVITSSSFFKNVKMVLNSVIKSITSIARKLNRLVILLRGVFEHKVKHTGIFNYKDNAIGSFIHKIFMRGKFY